MGEKVSFFVRGAYAVDVAGDESLRNAEGKRFAEMIGTLVAADVPFSQIEGETWKIRRSVRGIVALLAVEIDQADVKRFAKAVKRCAESPGLTAVSVDIFVGDDRAQAQKLLLG